MPVLPNSGSVLDRLHNHGFAVIKGYFNPGDCRLLQREVARLVEAGAEGPYGRAHRLYPADYPHAPEVRRCFVQDAGLERIARAYWRGPLTWCSEVFCSHEYPKEAQARQGYLHFDRLRTFKCFAYLTATTATNGALHVLPGSHHQGRQWRERFCPPSQPYADRRNRPGLDFEAALDLDAVQPLEGGAGTLILFDSDVLHRGGRVFGGHRWVVRSHSR